MKQGIRRVQRMRIATGLLAAAMTLMVIGIGTTGASAAQMPPDCADAPVGQAQGGSTSSGRGSASSSGEIKGSTDVVVEHGEAQSCGDTAGVTFAVAPDAQQTCAVVLPDGALPGSTIIVRQGIDGSLCSFQVVGPDGATTGAGMSSSSSGGYGSGACVISLPANVTGSVDAGGAVQIPADASTSGEAGSVQAPDNGTITLEPVPADQANTVEIAPENGTIAIETGPANGGPGMASACGTFTVTTGGMDASGCTVIVDGGEAGSSSSDDSTSSTVQGGAAGQPGDAMACPVIVDGGAQSSAPSADGGATTSGSGVNTGGGKSVTCVSGANPNDAPVCTTQP